MSLGRWSLGVLIFEMCHGYPPFRADIQATLFENILLGRKRYKVRHPGKIHTQCYDNGESIQSKKSLFLRILLSNLLQVQPEERYGLEDVKNCEWFKSVDWNEVFLKKVEPPKVTFRQAEPKEKLNECDLVAYESH